MRSGSFATSIGERAVTVTVLATEAGRYRALVEGVPEADVRVLSEAPTLVLLLKNRVLELDPESSGTSFALPGGGRVRVEVRRPGSERRAASGGAAGHVQAPMPGRIVKVLVADGETVERGAGLVIVEAMKMENEIGAPRAGRVTRVRVAVGDAVERDALLVELE